MKILILLLIIIALMPSCQQQDPNPELKDLIFLDIGRELGLVKKSIESIETELSERRELLRSVVPQTGQLKGVEKKVFESQNNLERLKQQKQFFEIKAESRKAEVQSKYRASLHGGPRWPDEKETEMYQASIKFQREKLSWDKKRGMIKNVPRGTTAEKADGKTTLKKGED